MDTQVGSGILANTFGIYKLEIKPLPIFLHEINNKTKRVLKRL